MHTSEFKQDIQPNPPLPVEAPTRKRWSLPINWHEASLHGSLISLGLEVLLVINILHFSNSQPRQLSMEAFCEPWMQGSLEDMWKYCDSGIPEYFYDRPHQTPPTYFDKLHQSPLRTGGTQCYDELLYLQPVDQYLVEPVYQDTCTGDYLFGPLELNPDTVLDT